MVSSTWWVKYKHEVTKDFMHSYIKTHAIRDPPKHRLVVLQGKSGYMLFNLPPSSYSASVPATWGMRYLLTYSSFLHPDQSGFITPQLSSNPSMPCRV